MSKSVIILKRIVRAAFWVALGFVILFILAALLIQIPSVQNKIVDYAASRVSGKIHSKMEIKNVAISFPKAIVLEGIYVEDTQTDTLFYAGKVKDNIALFDLFSSKINIGSFALEDATIKLYSSQTDSLFNYSYLITAFSDTTKQVDKNTPVPSKWIFSLDKVKLKNVLFTYNDVYGGMNVFAEIEKSDIRVMEIASNKSMYAFNELLLIGLTVDVQKSDPANTQTKNQEKILPKISAKNLQINNSSVTYSDSDNYLSVVSVINQLELADASIDIQKELLVFDRLTLSKSDIRYHNFEPEFISGLLTAVSLSSSGNNWKVAVTQMKMADNGFIYQVGGVAETKNEFSNLNLDMRDVNFKNPDALYFRNDLINLPFFTNLENNTTLSGTVNGALNNLTGKNLVIKTGKNTVLKTDFSIAGLPDVKEASYNFPNLKVISGKIDLEMLAGPSIPEKKLRRTVYCREQLFVYLQRAGYPI